MTSLGICESCKRKDAEYYLGEFGLCERCCIWQSKAGLNSIMDKHFKMTGDSYFLPEEWNEKNRWFKRVENSLS